MRRALWFVAGAGVGVYAMARGRRAAEVFTAEGLHDRWQALGVGARLFRDEVATGKVEAEARLRERFGPTYDDTPRLPSGAPRPSGPDTPSLLPHDGSSTNANDNDSSNRKQEGPQ